MGREADTEVGWRKETDAQKSRLRLTEKRVRLSQTENDRWTDLTTDGHADRHNREVWR